MNVGLKSALVKLFQPKGRQVPETALFYFSGHGIREDVAVQEGFLATSNVSPSNGFNGLSLQWLRRLLQESPVRQQIIWLDCCHSGELLNFNEANPGTQGQAKDRCFIASSREFEPSLEDLETPYSVLTKYLLKGLDPNLCPRMWRTTGSLTVFINENLRNENQIPVTYNCGEPINLTCTWDKETSIPKGQDSKDICPYKGLEYFDCNEEDPKYFYGREKLTDKLIDQVRQNNFLAILGASGSGKSSVLRAGLLHQLKLGRKLAGSQDWKIQIMLPGEHPLQSLALSWLDSNLSDTERATQLDNTESLLQKRGEGLRRLVQASTTKRIILVIDQFEEAFTLCQDLAEREAFFQCLLEALEQTDNNKLCLILAMRGDFFGKCIEAEYSGLGQKIQTNLITIPPMKREELTEVIRKPAKKSGFEFEPGLAERILNDVDNEPGNLALLEFALTELWKTKTDNQLTHKSYQDIGQVKGALAKYADEKYENLTEEEKKRGRSIFIQLLYPGKETKDTGRRANREELGEENWNLIIRKDGLADSRLVVTGRDDTNNQEIVEVVHEALIQNWGQLRKWSKEYREFRTWQERNKRRTKEWKEGREQLLSERDLETAEEWRKKHEQEISRDEKDFINESLKEQEKQQNNKKIRRFFRGVFLSLSSVMLAILGTYYYQKTSCDVGERVGQDCFRFIITSGDSQLFVGTTNEFLEKGVENFAAENFEASEEDFENAKDSAPYDPIPRIYENNARAINKGNPYKLGVVVPVDAHQEVARNMLRGVAYAQNEFNNNRKDSEPLLEIIIANDKNHPDIAKKIAKKLVKKNILGVIGHRSSGSSLAAIETYHTNGISMVSPTSGSTELDNYVPKRSWVHRLVLRFLQDYQDKKIFFRAVASNEDFADNFYAHAKTNCLDKDKKVWVVYDSKAKYSKNLKSEFDEKSKEQFFDEKSKEQFDEMSFNDLLEQSESNQEPKEESKKNRAKEELKKEIKNRIAQKVRCVILIPSTKTTSVAISIVYAYQELSKQEKLSDTKKIIFLSGLALHNNQTLNKDGLPFDEGLVLLLPMHQLEQDQKKCLHDEVSKSIQECIRHLWGGNVSWRTYTSYKATQVLTEALKKLDEANEKITTSDKRKIVLNSIKSPDITSCLMPFNHIQENKLCPNPDSAAPN